MKLFHFWFFIFCGPILLAGAGLKLEIEVLEEEIGFYEALPVLVHLENTKHKAVRMIHPDQLLRMGQLRVEFREMGEAEWKSLPRIRELMLSDQFGRENVIRINFQSGEKWSKQLFLSHLDNKGNSRYASPGVYELRAIYTGKGKKTVVSAAEKFEVLSPSPTYQQAVQWLQAHSYQYWELSAANPWLPGVSLDSLEAFISQFPENRLTPYATFLLASGNLGKWKNAGKGVALMASLGENTGTVLGYQKEQFLDTWLPMISEWTNYREWRNKAVYTIWLDPNNRSFLKDRIEHGSPVQRNAAMRLWLRYAEGKKLDWVKRQYHASNDRSFRMVILQELWRMAPAVEELSDWTLGSISNEEEHRAWEIARTYSKAYHSSDSVRISFLRDCLLHPKTHFSLLEPVEIRARIDSREWAIDKIVGDRLTEMLPFLRHLTETTEPVPGYSYYETLLWARLQLDDPELKADEIEYLEAYLTRTSF